MNFVHFNAKVPVFSINCNGIKMTIREGKYPEDWIWDVCFGTDASKEEGTLSIEVMKTVEIHYSLSKTDKFTISFEGREGDAFSNNKSESNAYTFEWSNKNWKIESIE